jgi:hypothetical protein
MDVVIFIFWIAFSIALGFAARERGRSVGWMFLSLLISPLIAGIFLYILPKKAARRYPFWSSLT